jgi:aspartate-semialdehyde dehydrogenase
MTRIPVTVLGATGVVGQRFVRRIANHPYFELHHLAASERNAGKTYAEACEWRLGGTPYAGFGASVLTRSDPAEALSPIVFSALDAAAARDIEPTFATAGALVFSNASAFRMDIDVPLIVPELNAAHLALITVQRARRGWGGAIVCNPNCTTTVALGALGPLYRAFGMDLALITSLQALSGAGYPGVSALDVLGNVIPFIRGEEEKVEEETRKILGTLRDGVIKPVDLVISAQCNRVPVADGHTICISARLGGGPDLKDIMQALEDFVPDNASLNLPSAPRAFLQLREEIDRPQPRRDAEIGDGMTLQIGRVRQCPVLGAKLVVLGHNAERGAAGGSVLNAELAIAGGYL